MSLVLAFMQIAGLAAFTYGCGLAWRPLWFIVGGLCLLLLAVAADRNRPRPQQ